MAVDQGTGPNPTTPLAKATAAAPTFTEGIVSPLSQDLSGNLRVLATIGAVSVATDATATAAAPSYTEGTVNPLSQNLTGDLRTIAKIASGQTLATVTTVSALTAITNALPAGANLLGKVGIDQTTPGTTNLVSAAQSGTWTIQPGNTPNTTPWLMQSQSSAGTGGIPSTARLLSAAGSAGDATNVKASAGRVYAIQGGNVRTSAVYLKLYNSASAPTAGSGTPVKTLYIPPSCGFVFDWADVGLTFSTGIGFTLVTGVLDNNSTSVTAGDILALNIDYA